ncbi:MAG: hypothetical protein AB7O80_10920 [Acetobacteraceae bacterium]
MTAQPYILIYRPSALFLIGPFGTPKEASRWVRKPENNPLNDPRWVVVNLTDPQLAMAVPVVAANDKLPALEGRALSAVLEASA